MIAADEQETKQSTMNANVSDKVLREIYLKPFEIASKEAKSWVLMKTTTLSMTVIHCVPRLSRCWQY
jgi:beta-glucosidase-like glycosyl hydrolase